MDGFERLMVGLKRLVVVVNPDPRYHSLRGRPSNLDPLVSGDLVSAGVDRGFAVWRLLAGVLDVAHAALVVQRLLPSGEPLRRVLDVVPSCAARGQRRCDGMPRAVEHAGLQHEKERCAGQRASLASVCVWQTMQASKAAASVCGTAGATWRDVTPAPWRHVTPRKQAGMCMKHDAARQ